LPAATLHMHPHVCGRCESVIAPFCSAIDGTRCRCPEPASPKPVPDGELCFFTRDAIELRTPAPIDPDDARKTGSDLLDVRAALVVAAARIPLDGNEDLHLRFNELVNQVDGLGLLLSDRWAS